MTNFTTSITNIDSNGQKPSTNEHPEPIVPKSSSSQNRGANQRGMARLGAVQALYQMDIGDTSLAEIKKQFLLRLAGEEIDGHTFLKGDADYFNQILTGVLKHQLKIDPMVELGLDDNWSVARIDATLRAILRAGAYELMFRDDIPTAIVISEYVDVAKAFFDGGKEPKFVNAVLDQMAREAQPGAF